MVDGNGADAIPHGVEKAAWMFDRAVRNAGIKDADVRIVDGELRDIRIDGTFLTLLDGDWFAVSKV